LAIRDGSRIEDRAARVHVENVYAIAGGSVDGEAVKRDAFDARDCQINVRGSIRIPDFFVAEAVI
jgi:uncharacterized membrane protein